MNWRDFFEQRELDKVAINMQNHDIPEENEEDENSEKSDDVGGGGGGGSDSDPSEDNIDPVEFLEIIQTAFKDDEDVSFKELFKVEPEIVPRPRKMSIIPMIKKEKK